jgi:hypothetical protein
VVREQEWRALLLPREMGVMVAAWGAELLVAMAETDGIKASD